MENDVLKNKIAPWQEKGRWYHAVYNYSTQNFEQNETDRFILDKLQDSTFVRTTAGNYHFIFSKNDDIQFIDCKIKPRGHLTPAATIGGASIGTSRSVSVSSGAEHAFGISYAVLSNYISAGLTDIWFFISFSK